MEDKQSNNILEVSGMSVSINVLRGSLQAVRGISFDVKRGEVLGIVGESGCGKSTAMLALTGLLPQNAKVQADSVRLNNVNIDYTSQESLRSIRGSAIAYIFQDPQASLNPVLKISDQIIEALKVKNPSLSKEDAMNRAVELLNQVKITNPKIWLSSYPHQLSGGMKQRVMIAIALANSPAILIADEPTTSLDVTVQSEILQLLKELNRDKGMSILFITHDLSVAGKICDRIMVMYAGRIVEIDSAKAISENPHHPYTYNLWKSIPRIEEKIDELAVIPGNVPNPLSLPTGCKFHPRCMNVLEKCRNEEPDLNAKSGESTGFFACYNPVNNGVGK